MRLLSLAVNALGCAYYRQIMPWTAMRDAGLSATLIRGAYAAPGTILAHDVIQVGRVASHDATEAIDQIQAVQRLGKRVVIDYDDDLLHIPAHNGSSAYVTPSEVIRAVATADAITVTNTALAAVYRPYAKQIAIIPNYVDVARWPKPTPREGLTIGLVGSHSHHEDWKLIVEPMRRIRERFPHVRFLVAGYMPDYLAGIATEHVPWQHIEDYQKTVNRIDIGLCPLIADDFNKRKTPIKAMEYALAHAVVVASPTTYRDLVQGKGTLARSASDWETAIATYIQDADRRRRDAATLRHYVVTKCDVARHAHAIYTTYRHLFTGVCATPPTGAIPHGRRNPHQRAVHTG